MGKVRPASLRQALTRIDLGFHQGGSGKSSLIKTVFKVDVTVRSHTSVILRRRRDRTMKTNELKDTQGESDINVGFVQKITVTSLSMSFRRLDLRPGIRKSCGLSGTSSHTVLTQVARLQKGYTLSGKEAYFCDDNALSYL